MPAPHRQRSARGARCIERGPPPPPRSSRGCWHPDVLRGSHVHRSPPRCRVAWTLSIPPPHRARIGVATPHHLARPQGERSWAIRRGGSFSHLVSAFVHPVGRLS